MGRCPIRFHSSAVLASRVSGRWQVVQEIRNENRELQALRDKMTPPGVEAIALQIRGHASEKILSETVKLSGK